MVNSASNGLEVAVIGMSCRLPKSADIHEFWSNIRSGKELISFFSAEELKKFGLADAFSKNDNFIGAGGILDGIDQFDSDFFAYTPAEASKLSPQSRIFHQCVWHALEDSGYDPYTYQGAIGLFAGCTPDVMWEASSISGAKNNTEVYQAYIDNSQFIATRIGYKLNFKGPCITLNTACSTSLVAIHMACQSLLAGECEVALAGGVSITNSSEPGYIYQEGLIMSSDGHCRPFDEKANGTVPGDGTGVVVLKRLEEALADNDHIYAVVKGSAVNNDGNEKVSYTAPSVSGQERVIKAALQMAEVPPSSIDYIETHGTATHLGDPIEARALKNIMQNRHGNSCAIGSVKSNIGHLDVAAGVASFIKTVLAVYYKEIPPSLNFEQLNPKIDFGEGNCFVNNSLKEWKKGTYPRRAGVSSFGIGGTNAHVILEEAPPSHRHQEEAKPGVLLFSAKSKEALKEYVNNFLLFLKNKQATSFSDICYSLSRRATFKYRHAVACKDSKEAADSLEKSSISLRKATHGKSIAFMFTGQGSQYVNMGRGLYESYAVFKEHVDFCLSHLERITGEDLKIILYPEGRACDHDINDTAYAQPLLFTFEYALSQLVMNWGLIPNAVIGHSLGEIVAACISGIFDVETALKLVVQRGRLMQAMTRGSMISVLASAEEVEKILSEGLSIAVINNDKSCVVSGNSNSLDEFIKKLKEKDIISIPLKTSHAFHSEMMDPMLPDFRSFTNSIYEKSPEVPIISNVTGGWLKEEEVLQGDYWVQHVRNTVLFSKGVDTLISTYDSNVILIEIGPGNTLVGLLHQHIGKSENIEVIPLVKPSNANLPYDEYLLQQLAHLWSSGANLQWQKILNEGKLTSLPSYPFHTTTFPVKNLNFQQHREGQSKQKKQTRFYTPQWMKRKLGALQGSNQPKELDIYFLGNDKLGETLVEKMEGEPLMVRKAAVYEQKGNEFYVRPDFEEDYENLFAVVKRMGSSSGIRVIFLWSVSAVMCNEHSLTGHPAFFQLLSVAKAIERNGIDQEVRFEIITGSAQDVTGNEILKASQATILGAAKVIPLEFTNMSCRCLDVELPEQQENAQSDRLIRQLLEEFRFYEPASQVAFRGAGRWVSELKTVEMEGANSYGRIKENGIYLVTGGLGGIPLHLIDHLSKHYRSNFILFGRSEFPDWKNKNEIAGSLETRKKVDLLRTIEERGAQVEYFKVDVTNEEELSNAVSKVLEKWGTINGVIHAAGLADHYGAIRSRSQETIEKIMEPKIGGAVLLDKLLQNINLDFFVLFSSLSSLYGWYGEIGYVSANTFLDAFAKERQLKRKGLTLSINWTAWKATGMRAEKHQTKAIEPFALSVDEGVKAFEVALSQEESQVIILKGELGELKDAFNQYYAKDGFGENEATDNETVKIAKPRPELANDYVSPTNEEERIFTNILEEQLGIDKVGIHDNFFELGLSSLTLAEVNSQLSLALGKKIPLVDMFNHPTVYTVVNSLKKETDEDGSVRETENSEQLMNQSIQTINQILGKNEK